MQYSMLSKEGKREHNEDYIGGCVLEDKACFVLADGLGGHGKGEIASKCVVDSILYDFKNEKEKFALDVAIQKAQEKLLNLQKEINCKEGMKTTIVVLYIEGGSVQWAHVGDSRLYLWNHWRLITRTLDHSVPQMLVLAKEIKEKEIRFHEDRNRLLKAMGNEQDNLKPEISEKIRYKKGQVFLMCSDGFWEYIDEKQMWSKYITSKLPEEWLKKMEDVVCRNGEGKEMDNYSAIAVWM